MPDVREDKQALDWVSQSYDDPNVDQEVLKTNMGKLGITPEDAQAWRFAENNPTHEMAVPIRNKIYKKVANSRPAVNEQGVSTTDRLVLKNLIDEDPDLQEEYLKRKGFDVRRVEIAPPRKVTRLTNTLVPQEKEDTIPAQTEIQVRRPGETRWGVVDPRGIDAWDAADILTDVAEAGVTTAATGAKALGLVGAPATGGASLLATAGFGAAAGAGYETAKQSLAKSIGARQEYDPSRILLKGAMAGGIPTALKAGGIAMKGVGKGIGKLQSKWGSQLADNVDELKKAGKVLGTEPTKGQLFKTPKIKELEDLQLRTAKIPSMKLSRQVQKNIEALEKSADLLMKDRSFKTATQSGEAFSEAFKKKVLKKMAPIEAIYNKLEKRIGDALIDPTKLDDAFDKLEKRYVTNNKALKIIANLKDEASRINTIRDLKNWRTDLGRNLEKFGSDTEKRIYSSLYGPATEARKDTLLHYAKESGTNTYEAALDAIKKADKAYADLAQSVDNALLKSGAKSKFGIKQTIENVLGEDSNQTKVFKQVLDTNNVRKIEKLAKDFPEEFEILRQAKIEEIFQRADQTKRFLPAKLSEIINKLEPETKTLLFGENGAEKANALKIWFKSLPIIENPSKTATVTEKLNPLNQVPSLLRQIALNMRTNPQLSKDIFSKTGRLLESPSVRGFSLFGANQIPENKVRKSFMIPPTDYSRQPQGIRTP